MDSPREILTSSLQSVFFCFFSVIFQEFAGNSDLDTVVLNSLERPEEARFVRFIPKEWHNWIAMRIEIFGQKPLPGKRSRNVSQYKEKFHDFLTLLTSTEKLSTRAGFELAPSGTSVRRSTS